MFKTNRTEIGLTLSLLLICCAVPLLSQPAIAQQNMAQEGANADHAVPSLVKYAGMLSGDDGKPLSGPQGVTFLLYKEESGGAPLWMETQNVRADRNGHFSVMLGAANTLGLPTDVFMTGEARWLAVQVSGQAEQARTILMSVPYALKAGDAETLGGKPASAFGVIGQSASDQGRGVFGLAPGASGVGVIGETTGSAGIGVVGKTLNGEGMAFAATGSVQQDRTSGGWVKAMLYYSGFNGGRVVSCFNSTLHGAAATTPPCGFTATRSEPETTFWTSVSRSMTDFSRPPTPTGSPLLVFVRTGTVVAAAAAGLLTRSRYLLTCLIRTTNTLTASFI